MKKLLVIFTILNISTSSLYSQNKTIKGKVISDDLEALPQVSIIIHDSLEVGRSDLNGFFHVDIPISVEKISFEGVGLDKTAIEDFDKCDDIEVIMILSGSYDFRSPKKVNKLRMKKFKKLPELYKKAFEEGIFKIERICCKQLFIP